MELVYPAFDVPIWPRPTALCPSPRIGAGEEMFPVLDESGLVVGRMPRSYAHSGTGLLHPVVHLHLVDPASRIYLQKRSEKKDLYPGLWDTAVGGHVMFGESLGEALFREAAEELGLYDFNPVPIRQYRWTSALENEYVSIFAALGQFSPKPDGEEVSGGAWWTCDEILAQIGKSVFTPQFESEIQTVMPALQSLF